MNSPAKIDYLIVANHAEIINGMLYLMGGNFTDIIRPPIEPDSTIVNIFCAAISITIPSDSPNQLHNITVQLKNRDEDKVVSEVKASFSISQPPNIAKETEQHAVGVIRFNPVFPSPGNYEVVAAVDSGGDSTGWRFRVT